VKILILSPVTANKELLRELKRLLLSDHRNSVEHYIPRSDNWQKIQNLNPDMVITLDLSGFEFTTLTGGISYNLWNTKFIHFLLGYNLKNEKYLCRPLSISMFFYCIGMVYKECMQKKYPDLPFLEGITDWVDGNDQRAVKENARKMAAIIDKTAQKCGLHINFSPMVGADIYLQQIKMNKEETTAAIQYIDNALNAALDIDDVSSLLALIPFIESGRGQYAWKYKNEIRRILQILYIIQMETEYGLAPFSSGCKTKAELIEKYMVTLFALRRLGFDLSDYSKAEAERFLMSAGLSPFALHTILQCELLPSDERMYQELETLYADLWDEMERVFFMKAAEIAGKESEYG